ncbi:MAG: YceI family protein [Bacteroidetes bacterium]|nr:YceI family protein [Bacteroidota bacterium]
MKLQLTLIFGLALLSLNFTGPVETMSVNTQESVINWQAYKVTGQHEGTLGLKSGALDMQDGTLKGGSFVIDMSSINVTDLEGSYKDKLEGHLHSDDFFSTSTHPTASFKITNVVSRGTPGDYKITGDLTIKGITKAIKFNANVTEVGNQKIATADITVDRSEFNVRYGSGSFFDNLGDNTIYDEFDLSVKLVVQ